MLHRTVRIAAALAFAASVAPSGAWGRTVSVAFDAGDFSAPTSITNRYWGLRLDSPGPTVYFAEAGDGCEVSESEVIGTTGPQFFPTPYDIDAVTVRDREWISSECDGDYQLVEDTHDWYAQDDAGNVWYMGEDTMAWDEDRDCLTTEGSWQAGVDGAEPGIIMLARPRAGSSYRQEYSAGVAEDFAKVLRLDAPVSIEYGDYAGCLVTKEYTPLERGQIEHKFYCPVEPGDPGLVLIEELHGKTVRAEYVGAVRPDGTYAPTFPTTRRCAE